MSSTRFVLCVDDHADTCDLIAAILRDYEVISAVGKSEGLRKAKSQHFDLILLDYHLRDGTGWDLCRQIREFNANTPVLFVTGTYTMSNTEVLEVGAQGIVRKSDLADLLLSTVDKIFNNQNERCSPMLDLRFGQSLDSDRLLLISRRCMKQRERLTEQLERLTAQRERQWELSNKLLRHPITDEQIAPSRTLKRMSVVWSVNTRSRKAKA